MITVSGEDYIFYEAAVMFANGSDGHSGVVAVIF